MMMVWRLHPPRSCRLILPLVESRLWSVMPLLVRCITLTQSCQQVEIQTEKSFHGLCGCCMYECDRSWASGVVPACAALVLVAIGSPGSFLKSIPKAFPIFFLPKAHFCLFLANSKFFLIFSWVELYGEVIAA